MNVQQSRDLHQISLQELIDVYKKFSSLHADAVVQMDLDNAYQYATMIHKLGEVIELGYFLENRI